MGEQPVSVSADDLAEATRQAQVWQDAVHRAEQGEIVPVIAHGEHVADVVPSGELDRLRETIEVLSDHELVRALAATLIGLRVDRGYEHLWRLRIQAVHGSGGPRGGAGGHCPADRDH